MMAKAWLDIAKARTTNKDRKIMLKRIVISILFPFKYAKFEQGISTNSGNVSIYSKKAHLFIEKFEYKGLGQ